MLDLKKCPTFYFNAMPVGVLIGVTQVEPGIWEYDPYRGIGHYKFGQHPATRQPAICETDIAGKRVTFVVVNVPTYGM